MKDILFVAVDAGPVQVMQELVCHTNDRLLKMLPVEIEVQNLVEQYDIVAVGTSGSIKGRHVEQKFRVAAKKFAKPLVVIEDYVGNYYHVNGGMPDLLLVDCLDAKEIHQQRLQGDCPNIQIIKNPRYDKLRHSAEKNRQTLVNKWQHQSKKSILWAGQPETEDAVQTFKKILPILKNNNIQLLFKAHPRDEGYHTGIYQTLFQGFDMNYRDVTHILLDDILKNEAPRLLLTQYSSLAIEAGFYGVPAVHVLFEDIAQKRLFQDKGYAAPPHCHTGASWMISNCDAFLRGVQDTFFNPKERQLLMQNFDQYFGLMKTAQQIRDILLTIKHKK